MLEINQAVIKRHSVRQYKNEPIENEKVEQLNDLISKINEESGLKFELVTNEPTAFTGPLAHYGKFENCSNYIIIKGPRGRDVDVGYYGEQIVIFAQRIGLNTCWVALTYSKSKLKLDLEKGEKFYLLIAIGYGRHRGLPRKTKPIEKLSKCEGEMPEWFKNGMDFALRAPTAMNQQKFQIILNYDQSVTFKSFTGPCHKIDLGIVKYHFELGSNKKC